MESPVIRTPIDAAPGATAGVEIRCFPSDDTAFASCVASHVASLTEAGRPSPSALESRLRGMYPGATVHPQTSLGSLLPGASTWYVFRDVGH